jgi:Cof subfamily protein (haloacid dehalogenase superfamily)
MEELYISDLDGTLLNSSGVLSHKSIETLNSLIENGLNFTIATARSLDSAMPIVGELNLKLPMVLYNGVLVYDPIQKINIHENFIDKQDKKFIIEEFEQGGLEPIVFTLDQLNNPSAFYRSISNPQMTNYIDNRLSQKDKRFKKVEDFNQALLQNVITVISIGDKATLLAVKNRIENALEIEIHFAEDIYYKEAYWLEFAAPNSSKKDGVSFLKNHLNPEKIICFGDNLNDIPMFEIANEKYATSNARNELKAIATEVIGKNNDDAVARFLQNRSQINNL